jgi:hypothetical protein
MPSWSMELALNERKLHGASCRHAPQHGCLPARIGNQEACSTKPFCLSGAWTIPLFSAQGQPAIGPLQKRPDGFGLEDWYLSHQCGGRSIGNELRRGGSIRSPTMWVSRSENLGKKLGKAARAGIAIVCPSVVPAELRRRRRWA